MSDYRTFAECSENAQSGDAEALYQLGVCYAQGKGVEQNYQMAGKMWLQAARQKHALSQMSLGILFEDGLDVTQNYAKAVQCYQIASQQNLPEAKVRLAKMYYKGLGVEQDTQKAIALCIQAAEQGEPEAQFYLATAYYRGIGKLNKNRNLAVFWYQQASMQNHEQATEALKNIEKQKALEKAEKVGQQTWTVDKPLPIGKRRQNTSELDSQVDAINQSIKESLDKAGKKSSSTMVEMNSPSSENVLNKLADKPVENPVPVEQNTSENDKNTSVVEEPASETAIVMEKKTIHVQALGRETQVFSMRMATKPTTSKNNNEKNAKADNIPQETDAEMLYQQGIGALKNNVVLAVNCFLKSAQQGHAKSQYNGALSLLFGLGKQSIDIEQAVTWLQQSAEQDFRPSCMLLGWLYQGGLKNLYHVLGQSAFTDDVKIDNTLAIQYYQKAGELGHAQAQYFLAQIYETGQGVTVDTDTSLTWLRQSAKQGYTKAYEKLEKNAV